MIVARCSCGREYTLKAWRALRLVGYMLDFVGGLRELRDCPCASTWSIEIEIQTHHTARAAGRKRSQ